MVYYYSILVSVTEVCTVGCRHCGFTGAVRERQARQEDITDWVRQACDFGVGTVIFTGGEPFQRFRLLRAGVETVAAHPGKPRIGVFTSSFWGRSRRAADAIFDQLPGLTDLYLSTDIFHQERVPAQYVLNVLDSALDRRMDRVFLTITIAEDWEEDQIRSIYQGYEDRKEISIHVDRVIKDGEVKTATPTGHLPRPEHFATECFLRTPIINPNGDLGSCHVGKVGAHLPLRNEVYFLGNLHEKSFASIMADASGDYQYQYLRAFGPKGIAVLVGQSAKLTERFGSRTFANGCDMCTKVLFTRAGKEALRDYTSDPGRRDLIDAVRAVQFGELPQEATESR